MTTFLSLMLSKKDLVAQIKSTTANRNTDLTFKSSVNFSLTEGTKVVNEFKLVDDLGLEYDLVSVLQNEDIRKELGVSDEQFENLSKMKAEMTTALMSDVMKGVQSVEEAKMLEAKVKASDLEFRKQLNATQLIRLNQIQNQTRLERYGAAKLAESRFLESELRLTPAQAESTRNRCTELIKQHKNRIASWNQSANEKLLNILSSAQKSKLKKTLDDSFISDWKKQKLFTGTPKKRFRKSPKAISSISLLDNNAIRKEIELTESQEEKLNELKVEFEKKLKEQVDELLSESGKTLTVSQRGKQLVKLNADNRSDFESRASEILLKHQSQRLVELAVKNETTQMGTVQCICNGTICEKLDISDELAEKIYRIATETQRSLVTKIEQAEASLNQEVLQLFPGFDEAKLLGRPVDFKLR